MWPRGRASHNVRVGVEATTRVCLSQASRIARLLIGTVVLGGCGAYERRLPAPSAPLLGASVTIANVAPTGFGTVQFEVSEPSEVYLASDERAARARDRALVSHFDSVPKKRVCATTPCAVSVPIRRAVFLFRSNEDRRHVGVTRVDVTGIPTTVRHQLGQFTGPTKGSVWGTVIAATGFAVAVVGISGSLLNEGRKREDGTRSEASITFGLLTMGGGLLTIGGASLRWLDRPAYQPGATSTFFTP